MKKYLLNIGVVLFDRISMLFFQVWMASYYVKSLGISGYGQWSYTLNLITIILSLFVLGIDVIVIRDIVHNIKKAGEYIFTGITIQLVGFILVVIFSFLVIDVSNEVVFNAVLSILIANFFIILSKAFYWNYSALVESKYRTVSVLLSFVIFIPSIYIYLNKIETNSHIFFLYAIYYFIQFIISLIVYVFMFKSNHGIAFSFDKFREYFKIGVSLIISTFSVMLFTQTDVLMIKYFLGDVETGEFSAAIRLSTSVFILAGVIANTFYPKLINLNESDKIKFIRFSIATVTVLTIVGSIIVMLLSSYITTSLYGQNNNISIVLSLHIWCSIFIFSGAFTSRYLYAKEFYKVEISKTLFAAIINIALNIYFIPILGIIGAVVSSLLAYMVANYLALFLFKESRVMFFVQSRAFLLVLKPKNYIKEFKEFKCLFQ